MALEKFPSLSDTTEGKSSYEPLSTLTDCSPDFEFVLQLILGRENLCFYIFIRFYKNEGDLTVLFENSPP